MTQATTDHFLNVTEFAGQSISVEQLERICHRYHWAKRYCSRGDVVELACGGGQGLGLLAQTARSVRAGDISPEVLARAKSTYGDAIQLDVFPADQIPVADGSVDVLLLFEALYYLPDQGAFAAEAARVLRPGGMLLIATANKDLYDFTPSPHSTRYLGVSELSELLSSVGLEPEFAGYVDTAKVSIRQRIFRPLKYIASRLNLIPRTMGGKSLLKKLFFGAMTAMPDRIDGIPFDYSEPASLEPAKPNRRYKVIYCAARKISRSE